MKISRRYVLRGWCAAVVILVALLILPLRTTLIRFAIVALALIAWSGLFVVCRNKWLRILVIAATPALLLVALRPSTSQIDTEKLRRTYIEELKTYDKAPYVYGGENHVGIDCSGLVRAGMFRALQRYGFTAGNPRAIRDSFRLWWRDCNAIDLGKGRTGDTVPIGDGEFSKLSNHATILPGDLAVTESGSHVLAYLGDETWIEAEPNVGGTHIFQLSGRFAELSDEMVRFVRWRWLASNKD